MSFHIEPERVDMMETRNTNARTGLLEALITCSSVLGIAGYFFHNELFFLTAAGICTTLVLVLCVFSYITTPAPVRALYAIYGVIFSLLLTIGILVAGTAWTGLLLGACFIGVTIVLLSKLIDWIHGHVEREAPEWFDPGYDPFDEDGDEGADEFRKPVVLDEGASQQDRIRAMSKAFSKMTLLVSDLEEDLDDLEANRETLRSLARYMDSGLWKEDFEAVEKGELDAEEVDTFGVLSEDGLYNLLEETKEVLEEFKKLDYKN